MTPKFTYGAQLDSVYNGYNLPFRDRSEEGKAADRGLVSDRKMSETLQESRKQRMKQ